jgi:hypothetical protein
MKRAVGVLVLAVMAVALLVAGGSALAVIKTCPLHCFGTQGPDALNGSANGNTIKALGGDDKVHGRLGNDTLYGNPGGDGVFGDQDDDTIYGGNGNDFLHGGLGRDTIYTDAGADEVEARDGFVDHIVCLGGVNDQVFKDPLDTTRGC